MTTTHHPWKFFRAGGVEQVLIERGADLTALAELDQKLWVALAMPTRGVDLDADTLATLDTDSDGKIRPSELIGAIDWLSEQLVNLEPIAAGGDTLALEAIRDPAMREAARRLPRPDGAGSDETVALAPALEALATINKRPFNGDGIVPATAATEPRLGGAITEIVATQGGATGADGELGADRECTERFFDQVAKLQQWRARGDADAEVQPLGSETAAAYAAWHAVADKVDDFFARCRVAEFDTRAVAALNRDAAEYTTATEQLLGPDAAGLARFPIARVATGAALPLTEGINPAWAAAISAFASATVKPFLGDGRQSITGEEWRLLGQRLAPHHRWLADRPTTALDGLPAERIAELIRDNPRAEILALIDRDLEAAGEAEQLAALVKLLRLTRDLAKLLRNFVSFADFYQGAGAVFQAGTLYLDARSCNLCVEVTDAGRHATLAGLAGAFLAYCDCSRGSEKKTIVAVFTNGDSDGLTVGRNGIFYDRQGRDWDATVSKVVANPISVRQAFWAPYKKLLRMVEEQVAKRAAAADADAHTKLAAAAERSANIDRTTAPAPAMPAPTPAPKKLDIGVVAALGVAVGAIGTALSALATGLIGLAWWKIPLVFAGIILLISGPSMLIAWFKLRRRNLGPILDANGWAINTHARINTAFGAALTHLRALPTGSRRLLRDPFADKKRPWWLYITVALLILLGWSWYQGELDAKLPRALQSTQVLGDWAPAPPPPLPPPTPAEPVK